MLSSTLPLIKFIFHKLVEFLLVPLPRPVVWPSWCDRVYWLAHVMHLSLVNRNKSERELLVTKVANLLQFIVYTPNMRI